MPTFDLILLCLFVVSGVVFLATLAIATLRKLHDRAPDDKDNTPTPTSNGNFYMNDFIGDE